ncbi:LLM class flavin-dependent oxidoreductase [Pseudonocardia spinosispora]|uniref:LLM class flavin-dependent oxidoreductase n=1 Tax=Pseudonocardia spinosispora TaxID=103441 RepID=UPI0003FD70B2|nr:LLM class flavin-dependent oxidoreductase [Pseudonocardia spinosispora]
MRISLFLELPLPRPWTDTSEQQLFRESLDLVELADKAGIHAVWITEHHFLEEYCHSAAPEVFLGAASQRTERIRLGHGIMHLLPLINHPARVAERVSTLDLVSNGRVEFGTGESSTVGELEGFQVDAGDKRIMWEEAVRVATRCMTETPFTGHSGKYVTMPPRNVIPKPVQRPHPPVWVACTRHDTVRMAAARGIGALSFSFVSPEDMAGRVSEYYSILENDCVPFLDTVNANTLAIGGEMPLMCADTEEKAVSSLGIGGGFFSFGIMYYYKFGQHYPGRTDLWSTYAEAVRKDPSVGYGPNRGPVGTPQQVRDWCRRYEESGVDEVMFLINPGSHDATMESLELFGKEVLPEFLERDEKAAEAKARRMEPIIEKLMARRDHDTPPFDPEYHFGGVPTGLSGARADEALIAIQEMTEAHEREARRLSGRTD